MELEFEKRNCRYLKQAIGEVGTEEQTQEIRLGEEMPDALRIIGAWGQAVVRGKEWHSGGIVLTGGVNVWLLYAPEDGSRPRCLDSWIPFKMKWDLPEETPEGEIRLSCMVQSVDGRIVSPRKILARASVSVAVSALVPEETAVYAPGENCHMLELLQRTYPLCLPREAGEKAFQLEEEPELHIPGQVLCITACPRIIESRVLSDKVTFRGNVAVHLIVMDEAGSLTVQNAELPFSQFIQLDGEYGPDARVEILLNVTSLEQETGPEGRLRIKCGLVGQYLVCDREMLELTEDAYALNREITPQKQEMMLPAILETRTESICAEQILPVSATEILDTCFLPEHPRILRRDGGVSLEIPGMIRILCRDVDGGICQHTARWTGNLDLPADDDARIVPRVKMPCPCQGTIREGSVAVSLEITLELITISGQVLTQLCGVMLGDEKRPDPLRPSLILRRCAGEALWTIAKDCGSTVADICRANGLTEEPEPGKMLLIPVS